MCVRACLLSLSLSLSRLVVAFHFVCFCSVRSLRLDIVRCSFFLRSAHIRARKIVIAKHKIFVCSQTEKEMKCTKRERRRERRRNQVKHKKFLLMCAFSNFSRLSFVKIFFSWLQIPHMHTHSCILMHTVQTSA